MPQDSRRRVIRKKGDKYQLILREVIPDNAGVYTCKAINAAGDASCAVELSVKELPKEPARGRWAGRWTLHSVPSSCLKPVLNWANVCSPEHTSDTSTNYDSFLNWTFSLPNMVRTVQTLLHSQLACNEMQASARTCGRRVQQTAWWKYRLKSSQVKSVYFNHPSQGNSTNYYLILVFFHKSTQVNK